MKEKDGVKEKDGEKRKNVFVVSKSMEEKEYCVYVYDKLGHIPLKVCVSLSHYIRLHVYIHVCCVFIFMFLKHIHGNYFCHQLLAIKLYLLHIHIHIQTQTHSFPARWQ